MNEKALTVFEQYNMEISSTYRLRGNYGCYANGQKYILQEYSNSNDKMIILKSLQDYLQEKGFVTDQVVANINGEYVSESVDGYTYILKKWFDATECNIGDEGHVLMGAEWLGKFHKACENMEQVLGECKGLHPGKNMVLAFLKHNKEIVNIKNYIKKRKNKNYFEMSLQSIIQPYYTQAGEALQQLEQSTYNDRFAEAVEKKTINHGNYNHHNLLIDDKGIIMIHMMKINYAPQIQDLYDYLRKVMEKNNWDLELGKRVIERYSKNKYISQDEYHILKIMFSYPEKFWKIINYYYNSNKAWYSDKNEDKLKQFQKQEESRWQFIEKI